MAKLKSVVPISDENPAALPVLCLDDAIKFYGEKLGFSVVDRNLEQVVMRRDAVQIGLVPDEEFDPAAAGSLALAVDDLEELHEELTSRGGKPGDFGTDEWGGNRYRTFFLKEDENGYCYCFYAPILPTIDEPLTKP